MPITVTCKCGKAIQVPESFSGREGRCRGCGAAIHVPEIITEDVEEWSRPSESRLSWRSGRVSDIEESQHSIAKGCLLAVACLFILIGLVAWNVLPVLGGFLMLGVLGCWPSASRRPRRR